MIRSHVAPGARSLEVVGESWVDARIVAMKRARKRRCMMVVIVYSPSNC